MRHCVQILFALAPLVSAKTNFIKTVSNVIKEGNYKKTKSPVLIFLTKHIDGYLSSYYALPFENKKKMNQKKINKTSTKPTPNHKPIKMSAASGRHKVSIGEMSKAMTLYSREIKKIRLFDKTWEKQQQQQSLNSTIPFFQGQLFAFCVPDSNVSNCFFLM